MRDNGLMMLSPRPEPNVHFSRSMIVRDSYVASCSGVHLVNNTLPGKEGVIINFMEGTVFKSELEPLTDGWRAIAVTLSPSDARALAVELLKRAEEVNAR